MRPRGKPRWVGLLAGVSLCALVITGCAKGHVVGGSSGGSGGIGLPVYKVSVQKFHYSGMPATLKSGQVLIQFTNQESFPIRHEMVLLGLSGGKTAADIAADAKKLGPAAEDHWLHFGEVPDVDTGATKANVFSLPPGNYAFACFQTGTPQGKDNGPAHASIGMVYQFTVS